MSKPHSLNDRPSAARMSTDTPMANGSGLSASNTNGNASLAAANEATRDAI
jgi:hypothetical protein